jgi:hypothetical protein
VRVKHSHTLQNIRMVTLTLDANSIDFGTLLEGDANNDNYVTLTDFSILVMAYGKCQGTARYDPRADFNGDACVTLLDFSLLATNFEKSGTALIPDPVEAQSLARQTREAVTLSVDPATHQARVGETFTVTIRVQSGNGSANGAQASLDFDPAKLRVKRLMGNTTLLPHTLLNAYDNSTGTVDYAAGTFAHFPTGNLSLMQIEFEAIAATGATSLTFHHGSPRTTEVTFAGGSVLTSAIDGAISIADPYKVFLPSLAR